MVTMIRTLYVSLLALLAIAASTHGNSLLLVADTTPIELESGLLLHYAGRLAPEGTSDAGQSIDWYLLCGEAEGDRPFADRRWLWVLEEAGRGGWDWTRRWGTLNAPMSNRPASLNFTHDSGSYVVPLPQWHWDVGGWNNQTRWEDQRQRLAYAVDGPVVREGRSCWRVRVRTPIGVKRTMWIDRASGTLCELQERIFMGRGEKYELAIKLAGVSSLDDDATAGAWHTATTLSKLQVKLGKRQDAGSVPWTSKQLQTLAAYEIPSAPTWAPLKRILQAVERDRRQQSHQAHALDSLAEKAHGRDVRKMVFRDEAGNEVAWSKLGKRVTVLHFWEYRDSPLRPPYGQVGFLDYLSRKQGGDRVAVIGVVVHRPAEDGAARRKTVRSAKKLTQFMNLSYRLVYDDGSVLQAIGDPRQLGVTLPLYVVVNEAGKIVSYHSGYYPVDPSRGLQTLEAEIKATLSISE